MITLCHFGRLSRPTFWDDLLLALYDAGPWREWVQEQRTQDAAYAGTGEDF